MEFRIADTSTGSLARLTGKEQRAAKTTAFVLQLDSARSGMRFHRTDGAKDKNFWSVRASRAPRHPRTWYGTVGRQLERALAVRFEAVPAPDAPHARSRDTDLGRRGARAAPAHARRVLAGFGEHLLDHRRRNGRLGASPRTVCQAVQPQPLEALRPLVDRRRRQPHRPRHVRLPVHRRRTSDGKRAAPPARAPPRRKGGAACGSR